MTDVVSSLCFDKSATAISSFGTNPFGEGIAKCQPD